MNSNKVFEQSLDVARTYYHLIDSAKTLPRQDFLKQVQGLLAQLYALVHELPLPTLEEDDPEDSSIPRETANPKQPIYRRLSQYLGEANGYWMVLDPYDPEDYESVHQTLADDLGDIYWELQICLSNHLAEKDVQWQLRFNFEIHWGQHVVDALMAIHSLLYGLHRLAD
jgi:hypothetical protein